MNKKHLLMSVTIIAVLGIFFSCTQPGTVGGTTPATYTVTYDGNGNTGGSVPSDATSYEEEQSVTVLGNTGTLVKTGYSFVGWNTQADGNGTTYTQGVTFPMGTADVILYAKWTQNPTYSVTYDGNGNTGGSVPTDATSYEEEQSVTVLGNTGTLVKTGYSFVGWNTQADGNGTTYTQGVTFPMGTADVILYAKWTQNPPYSVTYDGNGNTGGSVPSDSNTYEQGTTVTVLDNTGSLLRIPAAGTGEAFKFDGWNTQADGNGTDYAASATFSMGTANVTLYAKWVAFVLRDTGPAGGLIFYDKGSYSDGWRYLEAALSDQSTMQVWIEGGDTQTTLNNNTSTAIGTGQANSDYIIAQAGHTGSAAKVCLDYVDGIYSDWFLPSKDELNQMYVNLKSEGIGGFAGDRYWSSSEVPLIAVFAWSQLFSDGFQFNDGKNNDGRVRAVRAF